MSYYYPQAAVKLTILPEDFKLVSDASLEVTQSIFVQAKRISVTKSDYRTADTFTMDIDYKSFPFDPRTIRAVGVTIYLQDMGSLNKADGTLNTLVPGGPTPMTASNPATTQIPNIIFMGFVDEESIEFNDTKREVHFEGRDCSALLIDQIYQDKLGQLKSPFSANQPLDVAIKSLLSRFPALSNIGLDTSLVPQPLPILASYDPDFGSSNAGTINPGRQDSYWDMIQKMTNRCGYIAYMDIKLNAVSDAVATIVIATPRNQLYTDDIKFFYGINVRNLTMKRKLGRLKNFNIKVTSRIGKQVVSATIPAEATPTWCQQYGIQRLPVTVPVLLPDGTLQPGTGQQAPTYVFPVPGDTIANKQALIAIGQTTYEQYSLQQLEGSFDTFEMQGRGSSSNSLTNSYQTDTNYDLTQIKKGQTICLEIDPEDMQLMSRFSDTALREQYLVQKGYAPGVAAIFARTMGKFSPRFKIKSHTMSLDYEQGFKLHIEYYNIVDNTQRGFDQQSVGQGYTGTVGVS